jgi:adenylate cyclase
MPRLIIHRSGEAPRVFELREAGPLHVGRAESNHLVLRDSSVSRRHATLLPTDDGHWKIMDQQSANGIMVNGLTVSEATLHDSDTISLGVYTARFESLETQSLVVHIPAGLPPRLTQALGGQQPERTLTRLAAAATPAVPGVPPGDVGQRLSTLEHENNLLTLLYEVSRELGTLATVDAVAERVLELVLQIEGVERGYAMLLDEQGNFLPALVRYRGQQETTAAPQMILSQSIIRQVMDCGSPIVVEDAKADARFHASGSVALSGIHSAMCAPLRSQEHLYGLLYVDNLSKSGMFSQEDLNVFAVIAAQAGLTIDHVRARQEVAKRILQQTALERFLSPGVAQKIVSEAANLRLGGETQEVTVLFADIRGFTRMAESLEPRQVVEMLNEHFNGLTEVIFRNEGTLDKYLGDGVMCLFGAPFSKEQDALRAVETAIGMQQLVEEMNRGTSRSPLSIGIGINTGPVIVGYIGASRRLDYTAIGDTVNVAARLTERAQPNQILISPSTHAQISSHLPARRLEPMQLKGKANPIDVYEILWREARPHTI